MTHVTVKGRDPAREAYRIETNDGQAWLPEHLIDSLRPGTRPSHQEAYEWIAAHHKALAVAIAALRAGKPPRKPYDSLSLIAPLHLSG